MNCPYCKYPLKSNVQMLGQTVICPECNAQVQMPKSQAQQTTALIVAIVGLILGVLILVRGILFLGLADSL